MTPVGKVVQNKNPPRARAQGTLPVLVERIVIHHQQVNGFAPSLDDGRGLGGIGLPGDPEMIASIVRFALIASLRHGQTADSETVLLDEIAEMSLVLAANERYRGPSQPQPARHRHT